MQKVYRLRLNKTQFFFHYFFVPVILITGTGLYLILSDLQGIDDSYAPEVFLVCIIFIAALYAYRQYKTLGFTVVETDLNTEQLKVKLKELAENNDWIPEFQSDSVYIYTTMFKWTNWGTLIHIRHEGGRLYFNSICDLYKRPSTLSFGQNKKNLHAFLKAFS